MDVKKLFALIPVQKLKELAQKHNYITGIKAPSQMLKAELVKSLSDHYIDLTGNKLVPVQGKTLEIPPSDIPSIYRPKKQELKGFEYELDKWAEQVLDPKKKKIEDLKKWAKEFIRVRKAPYEISKENREAKALQYASEKKLKEAITKREKRQVKEKQKRQAKKAKIDDKSKKKVQKVEKVEEVEEKKQHKFLDKLEEFYNRVVYLDKIEDKNKQQEYYDTTINKYVDIEEEYNKVNKALTKEENNKASKIFDKINIIIDKLGEIY
jgi:hypothetical protein